MTWPRLQSRSVAELGIEPRCPELQLNGVVGVAADCKLV